VAGYLIIMLLQIFHGVRVKLMKSVNIWQRYGQKFGGMFYMAHDVESHFKVIWLCTQPNKCYNTNPFSDVFPAKMLL